MSVFRRFPSYDQIFSGAISTIVRFPFALLAALVGVAAAVNVVGPDYSSWYYGFEKLLACAVLGLPLFIALTVYAEKHAWSRNGNLFLQAIGLVLLIGYYFSLPARIGEPMLHVVRFWLLAIGLHFLVAWLPWTRKDQLMGFWEYNKTLFLRFLVSALFSSVLYAGLALALLAADQLFGAEVKEVRYLQLLIVIAGLFNTWVFLAGVPKDLEGLNRGGVYPSGLRIFTQSILLPLVVLYFAILITYEAKIIITWNWPKGWVSELILWYSGVGIFSLLLLHPLRQGVENRWVQVISKWFYRLLIPLVAMLFLAIMRRITDYGFTENRYFVLAMAVGLAIAMLYMIVSKRKDVRQIPIVLCLMTFLSAYGPWSAFAVSDASQRERLESLLYKNGLQVNGNLVKPTTEPPLEERQKMSSVVTYLHDRHGLSTFSVWLIDSVRQELQSVPWPVRDRHISELLGFIYVEPGTMLRRTESVSLELGRQRPLRIVGYELMLPFEVPSTSQDYTRTFMWEQTTCLLIFEAAPTNLTLQFGDYSADTSAKVSVPLREHLEKLIQNATAENLIQEQMNFHATGAGFDIEVVLEYVDCRRLNQGIEINTMNGFILLRQHQ